MLINHVSLNHIFNHDKEYRLNNLYDFHKLLKISDNQITYVFLFNNFCLIVSNDY